MRLAVGAQGLGDFLHRLDARAHGLVAPVVEELGGPGRRVVVPELLEVFLEQIRPYGLEVIAQQIAEPGALRVDKVGFALEHAPSGFFEHRLETVLGQPPRLGSADIVEGVVHLGDDVKAVENTDRIGAAFADDPQVRLPHVGADELDGFG